MHALRIVALLAALAGCMWLGWEFIDRAIGPDADTQAEESDARASQIRNAGRAAIEERIKLAPEHADFYALLAREFPQDLTRMLNVFADRAAGASKLDTPDAYLAEALRIMRRTHGITAARASLAHLDRVFEAQGKIMGALSDADPRLCVDFLYGHATQAFFEFAARQRALVAEMALAGVEAMIDGRASTENRPPPGDADFLILERALQERGLSKVEIDALLDGKTPQSPIPDVALCRAGRIYIQTLRKLPDAARARIYALAVELLARS
jgi:hypothetical protein